MGALRGQRLRCRAERSIVEELEKQREHQLQRHNKDVLLRDVATLVLESSLSTYRL